MNYSPLTRIITALVVLVLPLAAFYYFGVVRKPHTVKPLVVLGQVHYFQMADQQGDTLTSDDLKGYVYLVDFMFTHCKTICPRMSSRMADLQTEKFYKNEKRLKLLSFTVDPDNDSIPVLKSYADQYHAIPGKWYFLRGPKPMLRQILHDFKLGVTLDSTGDGQISHEAYWALVDGDGKYRGLYKPTDPDIGDQEFEKMVNDIENVLTEKPTQQLHAQPH